MADEKRRSESLLDLQSIKPGTHCVSTGTIWPNPTRLKRGFQHRRTAGLGRTCHPQDSPRVEYPKLNANLSEYLRPSTLQRLQPSRCYKHFTTPSLLHGFRGLDLLAHRMNLILSKYSFTTPGFIFPNNFDDLSSLGVRSTTVNIESFRLLLHKKANFIKYIWMVTLDLDMY